MPRQSSIRIWVGTRKGAFRRAFISEVLPAHYFIRETPATPGTSWRSVFRPFTESPPRRGKLPS
jgi:hypothetical protein